MESLQGHIDSCPLVGSLEVEVFAEEEDKVRQVLATPSLPDTVPFLQMLQNGDPSPFLSFREPNFLALLSLQTLKKPWELESSLTHEVPEFHSSIRSETNSFYQNPTPISCMEEFNPAVSSQELPSNALENLLSSANTVTSSPPPRTGNWRTKRKTSHLPPSISREPRKRRRAKPTKNMEDIENQRMAHIAVERNRRRQMNDHLNSLRFLMPPSNIQRLHPLYRFSLEDLRLSVLHLNVTSSHASVFYSFNLKMEDDCILGSADEIETAVHQIFDQTDGRQLE